MKNINIYTDGACSGNQNDTNTGGWGCVLEYGEHTKELWGGEENTTNNRMELTALIEALKILKEDGLRIHIYSDSSYLVNCFKNKWFVSWQKNGWKNSKKESVENRELWEVLLTLLEKHECDFNLVKGHLNLNTGRGVDESYKKYCEHNGKIDKDSFLKIVSMNIRCDELANNYISEKRISEEDTNK